MADQPNAADQPNNLNHWLRAVRPDTPADHDWTDSAEADQVLAGVHRELAATGKPTGRRRPRRAVGRYWQPLVGGAVAAAAVVAALALPGNSDPNGTGFGNNDATGSGQLAQPGIRPAAMLLSSTNSCGQLLADLRSHTAAGATAYGLPGLFYGSRALASSQALTDTRNAAAGSDPSATSTTNVQEAGVDEPDIVKTEPGRLISLVDGNLRIIDASSRKVTGSLDLTRFVGQLSAQLLVDGDHALVIAGNGNGNGNGYGGGASNGLISPYQPSSVRSTYLFIDLSGQPKITGSMRADGSYLDARQVGSTVRLVVRSAPAVVFPNNSTVAANQRLIRALPLSSWLPKYSISRGAASTAGAEHTVPCGQVSHPAAYTGTSLLTVYTLDLNHLAADAQPITVAADGDTVYANGDSLYLASNPDWFCCMPVAAAIPTVQRTQLHRFDISGSSRPSYLGSTSIPGRLLSQYSLSEYAGSLRVATTRSTLPGPGIASRAGQS
ncbi:MAG: beta-propeller domain-containing protein, partial [Jatrophihabitantaceae bacterium]